MTDFAASAVPDTAPKAERYNLYLSLGAKCALP